MILSIPEWAEKSNRLIAEHCHVGNKFVGDVRRSTVSEHSSTETRVGRDGKKRRVPKRKAKVKVKPTPAASPGPEPVEDQHDDDHPERPDGPVCPECGHDTFDADGACGQCKAPNTGPPMVEDDPADDELLQDDEARRSAATD